MFKSIFARYVTAFMLIVLSSFLVIILIISSIIGNYSTDAKLSLMENCARTAATYVESLTSEGAEGSINESVALSRETATAVLGSLAQCSDDVTVLVADGTGRIILAVGYEKESVDLGAGVPKAFMDEVAGGNGSAKTSFSTEFLPHQATFAPSPYMQKGESPAARCWSARGR